MQNPFMPIRPLEARPFESASLLTALVIGIAIAGWSLGVLAWVAR